jgi:hypothetical protein
MLKWRTGIPARGQFFGQLIERHETAEINN